tara:strand:+ start:2796 stop:3167 length:372 start_codon:yes stop_codon:yes gene_type:complete
MKLFFITVLFGICKAFIPNPHVFFNSLNHLDLIVDKNILINIDNQLGLEIVGNIAKNIPNIDSIGHQVILFDKRMINFLLDNNEIPDNIKKEVILILIKISQNGDQIGTIVLDNFYKISNYLL